MIPLATVHVYVHQLCLIQFSIMNDHVDAPAFLRRCLTMTWPSHVFAESGKSSVIAVMLWHLFQHGSSDLVAITSYTWKIAQLINTPANPGYRSMTTFGIPMKRTAASPLGESDACKHIMLDRVVMIINDKLRFSTQSHLAARINEGVLDLGAS